MPRDAITTALLAIAALTTACSQESATPASAPAAVSAPDADADLATAEAFIDTFYTFDRDALATLLAAAPETAPGLLYY